MAQPVLRYRSEPGAFRWRGSRRSVPWRRSAAVLALLLPWLLASAGCATARTGEAAPEAAPGGAPAAAPAATPGSAAPASPAGGAGSPPPLYVGVIGDQTGTWTDARGNPDMARAYGTLRQGVAALNARSGPLDVVLHVGDLVENLCDPSVCTESRVRADFATATGILDTLRAPWQLAAGDHDVNPPTYRQNSPDRSRETLFRELYGPRIPGYDGNLWYSFGVGSYHFVALYSSQALWSTPRFGDVFLSQLRDDQLAWLERDLEAARRAGTRGIVVFLHHPLWYHWSGWQRVHRVLREYPVAAVVAGHFHYQQEEGTLDGIRYLTVGATGGKTKDGSRQAGDVQHVTVLEVQGADLRDVHLLALDGRPLEPTPRREMDRVQALDVVLGNLAYPTVGCTAPGCCSDCNAATGCYGTCTKSAPFAVLNPVWGTRDGRLVADCTTGAAAQLEIVQVGNPLDLPATVTVSVGPSGVGVADGRFLVPGCGSGPSCTLPVPSQTVSVANTSSVEVAAVPPLWQGRLVARGSVPEAVEVAVKIQYQPDSGGLDPLHLQSRVRIPVQTCP